MGFVSADKNKQMVNVSMIQTISYLEIKLKVKEKRRIGNIDYRQTRYNDTGRFNEIVFLQVDTIKKRCTIQTMIWHALHWRKGNLFEQV